MADKVYRLLVQNFGSTSTKLALFHNEELQQLENTAYTAEQLEPCATLWDQYDLRRKTIDDFTARHGVDIAALDAIVSRGGILKPLEAGTYRLSEDMVADGESERFGRHVASLGVKVAYNLGREFGVPAYTVDPPSVDEMSFEAHVLGWPAMQRQSTIHALNQRATGIALAKRLGIRHRELNAVIVHMGGGITVAAHKNGRITDVNSAIHGVGPLTPERTGQLPTTEVVHWCFSGTHTKEEILRIINGRGGLVAYFGTSDARELEARIRDGDTEVKKIYDAMLYQVVKEVGACAAVLDGKVMAVAATGGMAYSEYIQNYLRERTAWIAPLELFPGEDEMGSLAAGALRCLRGEEELKVY